MANIEFAGFLFDDAGAAINGATVNLYDRNTTTPVRATTTTNASGYFTISHATEGRFDVEYVNGSSKRRRKYDDAVQLQEVETANLLVRNPANTFKYDIVPAAITADRQLNLPLITATDTLVVLALAQTFLTGAKTFNDNILTIRNPADTFSYSIRSGAITANRDLTLPIITATDTLAVLALAQTFLTGVKTFNSSILAIRNPADTFSYTLVASAITAARNLTIPLITADDTLAVTTLAQTLASKTLTASPSLALRDTSAAYDVTLVATSNVALTAARQLTIDVQNAAFTLVLFTGTFTPGITFGGASAGMTFTTQVGRYTRIGNRVFFTLEVTLSAKGSSTGNALITGLPVTSVNASPSTAVAIGYSTAFATTATTALVGIININATTIQIHRFTAGVSNQLTEADFNNTSDIFVSGSYEV